MCRLENIVYAHCEHPGPYRIVDCFKPTAADSQPSDGTNNLSYHAGGTSDGEVRIPPCCRSLSQALSSTSKESQKLVDVELVYDMECYDCHNARECKEKLTMSGALDGGLSFAEKRKAAITYGAWGFSAARDTSDACLKERLRIDFFRLQEIEKETHPSNRSSHICWIGNYYAVKQGNVIQGVPASMDVALASRVGILSSFCRSPVGPVMQCCYSAVVVCM